MLKLRSECANYEIRTPKTKDVLENLIDEGFAISKIVKLLSVSESTIFRRMRQYSISKNIFSTCNEDELDASVGPLIKEYPFCGENILGQMLRKSGIKVQRWLTRKTSTNMSIPLKYSLNFVVVCTIEIHYHATKAVNATSYYETPPN
jgi:hypothetical protein